MGFMAGFGEGFSNSFENARERSARREDDVMRYTFELYSKRRGRLDEYEKEKKKLITAAKGVAERAGKPDAWPKILEWLEGGQQIDDAEKAALTGQFDIEETSSTHQMQPDQVGNSGNTNPVSEQAAGVAAQVDPRQEEGSGLFSQLFGKKMGSKLRGSSGQQRAVERIAEMEGTDPSAVQKILSGGLPESIVPDSSGIKFTPGNSTDFTMSEAEARARLAAATQAGDAAAAKNAKLIVDAYDEIHLKEALEDNPGGGQIIQYQDQETGQWHTKAAVKTENGYLIQDGSNQNIPVDQARILSEDEVKLRYDLAKSSPEKLKLASRQAAMVGMYGDAADVIKLAQKNGAAITAIGDAATWIHGMGENIKAIDSIMRNPESTPEQLSGARRRAEEEMKAVDGEIDKALGSTGIPNTAYVNQLIQRKLLLMAFKAGELEGQTGGRLSDKDYSRFLQIVSGPNDVGTFAENLKGYLEDMQADVDISTEQFNNMNAEAQEYQNSHGQGTLPRGVMFDPIEVLIRNTKDQKVRDAYQFLQSLKPRQTAAGTNPDGSPKSEKAGGEGKKAESQPQKQPMKLGDAIKKLRENPDLAKKFDEVYGEGAAASVLGGQ